MLICKLVLMCLKTQMSGRGGEKEGGRRGERERRREGEKSVVELREVLGTLLLCHLDVSNRR